MADTYNIEIILKAQLDESKKVLGVFNTQAALIDEKSFSRLNSELREVGKD